ncbi:unnamed protein product [Eruca vesicaria subsp. sativa]|uniref:Uncharacterized protein n=1 Tax=Eruca vesicaria subsp. sativa TaxID=29727 RepID=A0ABC8KS39_ERUVS|nr:unnamed protein product [Eruca vesicaria subsp. sativa]
MWYYLLQTHCKGNPKLNFHRYTIRALEDDFKHVVGISWMALIFLDSIHSLHLGTKLEHVISKLAHEVAEKHVAIEGDLVNAFEIAFFFWIWVTYGFDSCVMGQVRYIVPRLLIGYIYCSSAGVYLKSDILPHCEAQGEARDSELTAIKRCKLDSIRPVYIYGPLNNNTVEEWFFHCLKVGRPIPVQTLASKSHNSDFATAFLAVLGNEKASREIFNISGEKYVTFDGLSRACAKAGVFPEPEIVHYNPKEFDFVKKKAFPFRDQHFSASVEKAKHVLRWKPEFDLVDTTHSAVFCGQQTKAQKRIHHKKFKMVTYEAMKETASMWLQERYFRRMQGDN